MSWTKINESTRSLIFSVAVLGLAGTGLWFGAQHNKAEANTAATTAITAPAATFAADPGSLGAIPDGTGGPQVPGTPRNVTFTVAGLSSAPTNVEVSMTFGAPVHSWVGDIVATLIAPNGASHVIFGNTVATTATSFGDSSDLAGPYNFKDSAAGTNWWTAAGTAGAAVAIPSGDYRSTQSGPVANPAPVTTITTAFSGVTNPSGTWTLRLTDGGAGDTGAVSAASLTIDAGTVAPVTDANMDVNGDGRTDFVVARATDTPLTEATSTGSTPIGKGVYTIRERLAKDREAAKASNESNLAPAITWYSSVNGSGATSIGQIGDAATDFLVPEDYDGDGKDDLAVWRPGAPTIAAFYIFQSSNNTVRTDAFGQTGDDPAVVGDYDGDGKADPATFRCPALGAGDGQCFFFYRGSLTPTVINYVPWGFGEDGDFFANPGDFDGDGKYDFCLQRSNPAAPASGQFVLLKSQGFGVEFVSWGTSSDFIIPGDYDGDGRSDFCVRRTVSGARHHFILERDGGGTGASPIVWGITGDVSAPGDYDGDGKQDVAVWRPNADPTQNFFYVRRSSDSALQAFEWGQNNDAVPAGWYVH